ncbi:MerR family transcriptional regulator [Clostridium tarantellae]|uniref:MerR family transcriptional regulator n=1 Tax=Clostridium tarantellae TaxID=39493 RepID=A0A6I1MLE4_9CLOT|nr:MerR family transcriptional regulator [Clostridium tarantellae]MPQ43840.1 MerR family transcriptional regulator [Clostridium tarantellae]
MEVNLREKYLTIGEFAKLCGVGRKTLIFYDNIGIFSPEYKDEKGYRFYTLNQYDTFNILLELKEIGVSLDEIKEYLKKRNPKNYINMLNEEKIKIKEKIKKLEHISEIINNKIKVVKTGIENNYNDKVYLKHFEEENILVWHLENEKNIMRGIIDFINYCNENNFNKGYTLGAMVSKENVDSKKFTEVTKLFIPVNKKIKSNKLNIKPKGYYACINHKGSYESTSISYEKLLKYINENNYKILSDSYEIGLLDFFAVKDERNYLTQISILISE